MCAFVYVFINELQIDKGHCLTCNVHNGALEYSIKMHYTNAVYYYYYFVLVFCSALTHIMEIMTGPMMQSLENRLQCNKQKITKLEQEKRALIKDVECQKDGSQT